MVFLACIEAVLEEHTLFLLDTLRFLSLYMLQLIDFEDIMQHF